MSATPLTIPRERIMRDFECSACFGSGPAAHRVQHDQYCPGQVFIVYVVPVPGFDRALARDESIWL